MTITESTSSSVHLPVMAAEILHYLSPRPGQCHLDGTLGGGGHTRLLADAVGETGLILGLDRDPGAVARTRPTLASPPVQCRAASYADAADVARDLGIAGFSGIVLDLGLSSDQLADASRGFSFRSDGELDLRFDPSEGRPAWQLLSQVSEKELARIIFEYGEERFSRRIARKIVEERKSRRIETSAELAEIVRRCVPRSRGHRIDPATRTFQALRIAVNEELAILQRAVLELPELLVPGGRIAIISFHSLEDRIVKRAFRGDERLRVLTKKPLVATEAERQSNVRSRSAKLRVAERIEPE